MPRSKTLRPVKADTNRPLSYKPSVFFFRDAIDNAATLDDSKTYGRQAVRELEFLKAWARSLGLRPPSRYILSTEVEAKGIQLEPTTPSAPAEVILFPRDRPAEASSEELSA